ncbi:polysaccharide deacetylase family protein [Chloroflexota bacterium]
MSKLIVTTSWDDGAKSDLKLAELLNKYGIRGTFYIPKTYLDNPLAKDELRGLDKMHEVGAHTLNHSDLTKVSSSQAKEEIEGIKAYLEDILGHKTDMFCYPYGKYNKNIKEMVRTAGFIAARTCDHGSFDSIEDPYEWQISLHASNGSSLMTLKIWLKSGISIKSVIDWEIRAKLLFDAALAQGGVYHIWGHSQEIYQKGEWEKFDRVLNYISNKEGVRYLTNGEIFT